MKSPAGTRSRAAAPAPAPASATADGLHLAVLADEAVAALMTDPEGIYVDATFGRGGHARRILQNLGARGRLIALDRDPAAADAARAWTDPRFEFVHAPFSQLATVLAARGLPATASLAGVLIDLGVSSPQIDDPARGFSFRADGPLDMRMDTSRGQTAAQWLVQASVEQLRQVLRDYGDERFAAPIAKAIVARREAGRPIVRTADLAAVVAGAIPVRSRKDPLQHPATRTFQALRIFLNQELEEVAMILPQALAALRPGGRLAVISFHSLEDRIVKRFMAEHANPAASLGNVPLRQDQLPAPRLCEVRRIDAGAAEVAANPRARSARLRVAQRTAAPWGMQLAEGRA
jgi:16S rRNA (cytosine1402-N4)-methyltransferase